MPDQDAVMAITSGTNDMQAIMNLVWEYLLPAMEDEPLQENKLAHSSLLHKLNDLSLTMVDGNETSPRAVSISGKDYLIEPNNEGINKLIFNLDGNEKSFTVFREEGSFTVPVGMGTLEKGTYPVSFLGEELIASSGAWITDDTFQIRIYLYETPYYFDYEFGFSQDKIFIERAMNVSFGRVDTPPLKGTLSGS
jgi:hypothetical protein